MPTLNNMKKALHIGAGNIGRGFIGLVLHQAGYKVAFADVNASLITHLNEKKKYTVKTISSTSDTTVVPVQKCFNIIEDSYSLIAALAHADVITTAVGPQVLKKIAPLLAQAITHKNKHNILSFQNIIACENMMGGSEFLRTEIIQHLNTSEVSFTDTWIGFPNSAVDRIVPMQSNDDPLLVKVEPYYEWVIDRNAIKGSLTLEGAVLSPQLNAFIERKLYLVNAAHAAIAYLGYHKGFKTIKESLTDISILNHVTQQMHEVSVLLSHKHGFALDELKSYGSKTLNRFSNPEIDDDVVRVARSPLRKLSKSDRFIKPLVELYDLQLDSKTLEESIQYALLYNHIEDEEAVQLSQMITDHGYAKAFSMISGLPLEHPLVCKIALSIESIHQ